jgi:hypothetical protein
MAITSDLVDYVADIIQDTSYVDATILKYINRGLRQIAGGIFITYPDRTQVFSSPLPNLLTSDTVATSTSAAYVALPDDFGRSLLAVSSAATDTLVTIVESFAEFLRMYPTLDMSSSVTAVAVRGTRLYYQGIPTTSDTLTLHYYSTPTELEDDDDEPDCLPTHLHEELLVNYAAMKIYDQIEDGVVTPKTNTDNYTVRFNKAMLDLEMSIEDQQIPITFVSDYE